MLQESKKKAKQTEERKMMMIDMMKEIKELTQENNEYKQHMEEIIKENETLKKEMVTMKEKMKKIELTLDMCEKDKKKNNIIIKGLPIDTTDGNMLKSTMINFVNNEMGVKVEIRQARKINDRTCVIQLDTFEQKLSVLKNKIEKRQLEWFGHMTRMTTERQVKQIWETGIVKKRKRGRPTRTWNDGIIQILNKRRMNWQEATRIAQDRKGWKEWLKDTSTP
ncbi:hypothetical protein QE152_g1776 [Popillia japonica]|uniref:Endonuclease-reverse transcriptase n=1 Tax=Popillia japonica TaxID=7064 RepID=A0AAW1N5Z4_POPJA